jgi:hypothetical protein
VSSSSAFPLSRVARLAQRQDVLGNNAEREFSFSVPVVQFDLKCAFYGRGPPCGRSSFGLAQDFLGPFLIATPPFVLGRTRLESYRSANSGNVVVLELFRCANHKFVSR